MEFIAKQILNSLKCPLCQSKIDITDWRLDKSDKSYNFCCVANQMHYRIFFVHWEPIYLIEYETVVIYEGKYEYFIHQYDKDASDLGSIRRGNKFDKTDIIVTAVDVEGNVIGNGDMKIFSYPKKLFDFSNTTRDKVLNRLKTILVFQ